MEPNRDRYRQPDRERQTTTYNSYTTSMREREREREREKDREQGKLQAASGQMRPPSSTPQQQFSPTANSSVPTPSPTLRALAPASGGSTTSAATPSSNNQRPNLPFPAPSSAFNPLSTRTLPSPFSNIATSPKSASASMVGTPSALPKPAGPASASAPSLALQSPTGTPTAPSGPSLGGMRLSTMLGSTSNNMNDNQPQKNGRATVSPVVSNKAVSTRAVGAPGSMTGAVPGGLQPPPLPSSTSGKQTTSPTVSNTSMSSQLAREGERDRLNLATQRDRERARARSNSIQSASGAGGPRKTPTPAALPGRPGVSVSPRGMPSPAILSQSPIAPSSAFGNPPSSGKLLPPHVQLSAGPPPPGLGGPVGFRVPGQSPGIHGGLGMGGTSLGMTGMGNVASMAKEKQIRDNWWKREGEREEEAATHRREQLYRDRERERDRDRARDLPRDEVEMREAARRNEPAAALERDRENSFRAREREAAEIRARERERDTFMQQQQARDRERDREPLQEKKYVSASVAGASLASKNAQDREREIQHQQQQQQQQQQQLRPQKHIGGYRAPAQAEAMFHPPGPNPTGHVRIPSSGSIHPDARERDREREREIERSRYPIQPDPRERERERDRENVRETERRQMAEWGPHSGYGGFFGPGFRTTGPIAPGLDRPLGSTLPGGESYPQALQRQRVLEREREKERESQLDRERTAQIQARHGGTDPRMTMPSGPLVNAGEPPMKPLKQAIEVLNQPSTLSGRNPQPGISSNPASTDPRSSRATQPPASTALPRDSGVTKQELLSPTDPNGSHMQTSVAAGTQLPRDSSTTTGKSVRPKLDHAAKEAEQAHRRQSATIHAPLTHSMSGVMNGQQASAGSTAPVPQTGKSTHKRKRSEIYPIAGAPGPVVDDDIQIVGVSHTPQNRLVGDDGFGGRNQQTHTSTTTGSRKKSSKHHAHAQQPQPAAVQPLQQPLTQNPQAIFIPPANHINPQMLSAPPSRHLQVRSDAIEHYLRILGIEALRKHLGRVVYRGTDWLMDGELLASHVGGTLDVEIPGEFLPSRPNGSKAWCLRHEVNDWIEEVSPPGKALLDVMPGYADRKLWGTDVYTDDSDLLAVLVHAAWLRPILPRKNSQTDADEVGHRVNGTPDDLRVRLRIAPKLIRYVATERAGILSRGWGNSHDGVSIVVESIERIKHGSALKANSRRNAKLRMKAYLTERTTALGLARDSLEYPSLPIIDELTFLRGREIGFRMSIASLGDWLNNPDESLDEVSGDVDMEDNDSLLSSTSKVRNIWKNDLLLENASDRFRLSLVKDSALGSLTFDIYAIDSSTIAGLDREEAHAKLVVQGIPVKNVQLTNSGMFVRSGVPIDTAYGVHRECGQGWFVKVERYAWIDKQKVDVPAFADAVSQAEHAVIIAEDARSTDKTQMDDADQAMDIDDAPGQLAGDDSTLPIKPEASVPSESVASHSTTVPGDRVPHGETSSGDTKGDVTGIPVSMQPSANGADTDSADVLISESKIEDTFSTGPKSPPKIESMTVEPPQDAQEATQAAVDEIIAVKLEIGSELEATSMKPMADTTGETRQNDEGDSQQGLKEERPNGSDTREA